MTLAGFYHKSPPYLTITGRSLRSIVYVFQEHASEFALVTPQLRCTKGISTTTNIRHRVLYIYEGLGVEESLPYAWLEFHNPLDPSDHGISRTVFGVFHTEGFGRKAGYHIGDVQRNLPLREPLIDLANVFSL